MKKKIYVLVYGRFPTEKAYGVHALNQAISFCELGYDVTLCYPKTNNEKTIKISPKEYYKKEIRFKLEEVPFLDITSSKFFVILPSVFKKFLWLVRSLQWSFTLRNMISDSIVWSTNPVVLYVHRKTNHLIFEQHGQARYVQKIFIKLIQNYNSIFIGTTKHSYNLLKNLGNSLFLPNAIDTSLFKPNTIRAEDEIIVGYAGMLETYGVDKGMFKSVEQMLTLLKDFSFKVVVIGGPKNKLQEIENLVSSSKYADKFDFKDRMSQIELAREIASFDIGLVPYPKNKHMDKFASPVKIFEYLACGVVCLASDLEAHTQIEIPGMNYFKNDDFEDFKIKLYNLLSNPEELKKQKNLILDKKDDLSIDNRSQKILNQMRL